MLWQACDARVAPVFAPLLRSSLLKSKLPLPVLGCEKNMGLIANGPNLRHNPNLAHPRASCRIGWGRFLAVADAMGKKGSAANFLVGRL